MSFGFGFLDASLQRLTLCVRGGSQAQSLFRRALLSVLPSNALLYCSSIGPAIGDGGGAKSSNRGSEQ